MLHKAWNSKGEVPYCFPRSSIKFQGHIGQNITDFDPNWAFPDYRPVAAFKSLRFALFFFPWPSSYKNSSVCLSIHPSVPMSVCLSVCYTFFTMFLSSYHHEIFTNNYYWQRWSISLQKVKFIEVEKMLCQFGYFWTVTPALIYRWLWNDAQSVKRLKRGALLFFKVIHQISRSHQPKNWWFWPKLNLSGL